MKVMRYLEQKAQGMVEYALILAFVVGIAAVALNSDGGLASGIQKAFSNVSQSLDNLSKPVDKTKTGE